MVPTINMLADCRNRGGKKGHRLKSRWLMALGQKSIIQIVPRGVDRMWVLRLSWGFFWAWLGLEKECLWFFFLFFFFHS